MISLKWEYVAQMYFLCMEKSWTSQMFGVNALFILELELRV